MPKVTNICKDEAGDIERLPENTVLISINEEYGPLYKLKLDRDSHKVLTVRFADIYSDVIRDDITYHSIREETVLKILNFLDMHKGKDVIVHCAAGISRSGAVALYLHIKEGYELKPRFWLTSTPNKLVLGSLMVHRYEEKRFLDK